MRFMSRKAFVWRLCRPSIMRFSRTGSMLVPKSEAINLRRLKAQEALPHSAREKRVIDAVRTIMDVSKTRIEEADGVTGSDVPT